MLIRLMGHKWRKPMYATDDFDILVIMITSGVLFVVWIVAAVLAM
jgi:hypothetical protein